LNQNERLDIGEPSTTTTADNPDPTEVDETGHYQFTHLSPDTYTVREIITSEYEQTYPLESPVLGENLIHNGSFEIGQTDIVGSWWRTVYPGSNALFSWEIVGHSVDYCGWGLWQASDGNYSIDLDGRGAGGVQQTINTIPGKNYLVTFDLTGHGYLSAGTERPMTVTAAGQSAEFIGISTGDTQNMNYQPQTWQFTATDTTTTIEFYSTIGDSLGAVIDRVSVAQIIGFQRGHTVELESGQIVENINFGNSKLETIPPNESPTFISNPPTEVSQSGLFRYNAIATDPDADILVYDLPVKPEGMIVDAETGVIVWQPTPTQRNGSNSVYLDAGIYNVLVRAKDRRGGVDLQSFQVAVTPPNNSPVFNVP
jgi:choice-of-anchor C domain-containing protein